MDNTLWANTAVASGSALGIVVYTGQETRSLMNHSAIRSKVGLLDQEINQLTKVKRIYIMQELCMEIDTCACVCEKKNVYKFYFGRCCFAR